MLREFQFKQQYPITVMEDNTATIAFVDTSMSEKLGIISLESVS